MEEIDEENIRYREIVESRSFTSATPDVRPEIIVPTGSTQFVE